MSLRSVCGLVVAAKPLHFAGHLGVLVGKAGSVHSMRGFHVNAGNPRQSQSLAEKFSEVFSAQPHPPPDEINSLMNLISTQAPHNNVVSFNLFCRTTMDRWSIKGLRIGAKDMPSRKRHFVLVSGTEAYERIPIGVSLYVAAMLSRCPIEGVEVTVFPVMKPKEYELNWRTENVHSARGLPLSAGAVKFSSKDHEYGLEGPLRSYVMKRSTNFVDVGMELNASGSTVHLKSNSLSRPLRRAEMIMKELNAGEHIHDIRRDNTLYGSIVSPPAVVLELRDRHKVLDEEQISSCGDEVLSAIRRLVAETADTPRGFVL